MIFEILSCSFELMSKPLLFSTQRCYDNVKYYNLNLVFQYNFRMYINMYDLKS